MELPARYDDLTPAERRAAREEYARRQGGLCLHCGERLDRSESSKARRKAVDPKLFPPGFFTRPVHLHHDHRTGLTVGAVHCYCNAVLWQHHGE